MYFDKKLYLCKNFHERGNPHKKLNQKWDYYKKSYLSTPFMPFQRK